MDLAQKEWPQEGSVTGTHRKEEHTQHSTAARTRPHLSQLLRNSLCVWAMTITRCTWGALGPLYYMAIYHDA